MTLANKLLQKLSNWKLAGNQRHDLTVADEGTGWTATVTAERCDELGCLVWELALQRPGLASAADSATLRTWADRVASRATGLLEPLKVIEVDAERLEAQLRSQEPTQREEQRYYYEVLLKAPGRATVRRYRSGAHREQVAFALTHEALAKLTGDLTADK